MYFRSGRSRIATPTECRGHLAPQLSRGSPFKVPTDRDVHVGCPLRMVDRLVLDTSAMLYGRPSENLRKTLRGRTVEASFDQWLMADRLFPPTGSEGYSAPVASHGVLPPPAEVLPDGTYRSELRADARASGCRSGSSSTPPPRRRVTLYSTLPYRRRPW